MINGVHTTDFNMSNKDQAIEHIKASNIDIEVLKEKKIRWIGWRAIPKKRQELVLLVIEFIILKYANVVLN